MIVNTDADNQYDARDLPKLVGPILDGSAQMVIGDRQVETLRHFSPMKRALQKLGSWVVRRLSGTTVRDATSGFRAVSRRAALRLHVFTTQCNPECVATVHPTLEFALVPVPLQDVDAFGVERVPVGAVSRGSPYAEPL